jgi:hypothetical protein
MYNNPAHTTNPRPKPSIFRAIPKQHMFTLECNYTATPNFSEDELQKNSCFILE